MSANLAGKYLVLLLIALCLSVVADADSLFPIECAWMEFEDGCIEDASLPLTHATKLEGIIIENLEIAGININGLSEPACGLAIPDEIPSSLTPTGFEPIDRVDNVFTSENFLLVVDSFGFPERVVVNGENVIASPIKIAGLDQLLAGKSTRSSTRWRMAGNQYHWETVTETDHLVLINESILGYDRFIESTVSILPKDKLTFSSLGIAITMPVRNAQRIATSNDQTIAVSKDLQIRQPAIEYSVQELEGGVQSFPFSSFVQVVGDTTGIHLVFNTDKFWSDKNAEAMQLERNGEFARLTAEFINGEAQDIDVPIEFKFGLGFLPVKTSRSWDNLLAFNPAQFKDAKSVINRFKSSKNNQAKNYLGFKESSFELSRTLEGALKDGLETIVVHQEWTDLQGYPGAINKDKIDLLADLVDRAHRQNIRVLAYVGLELSESAPEWEGHAVSMANIPVVRGRSRGTVDAIRPNSGNSCYTDFLIAKLAQLVKQTNIDGVFLDLIPDSDLDINPFVGDAYLDWEGNLRGSRGLFASRSLMKRIYEMFHGGLVEDGIVVGHTKAPFYPSHAFVDYLLTGETQIKVHRNNPALSSSEVLSTPMLRSLANSELLGVPIYWLTKEDRGGPGIAENRSILLPHGILQRTQWPHFILDNVDRTMLNSSQEVLHEWKIWKAISDLRGGDISFSPYWKNSHYLAQNTLEGGLVSLWHTSEEAIVAISNPTHFEISGAVGLNSQTLNFDLSDKEYFDVLKETKLVVQEAGNMFLTLQPKSVILIKVAISR